MTFTEGGAYWLDQVRALLRGADPDVFLEWSEIIEKRSKEACGDSGARIIFAGMIDNGKRFTLDVDATDSDAMLCLLKSIQNCLDLMPSVPKQFYGALMEALASEAQKNGKLESPWRF
jgi:hypothetical protein